MKRSPQDSTELHSQTTIPLHIRLYQYTTATGKVLQLPLIPPQPEILFQESKDQEITYEETNYYT